MGGTKQTASNGLTIPWRQSQHSEAFSSVPGSQLRSRCGLLSAAVYFPQYHRDINNDIFWGKGFTEWNHLQTLKFDPIAKHSVRKPFEEYDLNLGVRRKHASLARSAGIGAFIFYSYWFEHGRRALDKPLMELLPNEHLGSTFALSWANEPWTRRWNGESGGDTLMYQTYGTSFDWASHFTWLMQFFNHPEYLYIDGRPVLFIYNIQHIADAKATLTSEGECDERDERDYGPGGLQAALLYKKWYVDLDLELSEMYKHWVAIGKAEGRQWPQLPCTETVIERQWRLKAAGKAKQTGSLLVQMTTFLQAYARERGFKGIFFVGTLNSFVPAAKFDGLVEATFDAAAQFLPMNLENQLAQNMQLCGCDSNMVFHKTPEESGCPPSCSCVLNVAQQIAKEPNIRPKSSLEGNQVFSWCFQLLVQLPSQHSKQRGNRNGDLFSTRSCGILTVCKEPTALGLERKLCSA